MLAVCAATIAIVAGAAFDSSRETVGAALPSRMPESVGRTFYVDGSRGANRGRGTRSRPWRTISYALARVPLRGSTIYVRGGTYTEMVSFERRGDPRNPVTLRPHPGERVLLTAPPNSRLHAVWIHRARGFRLRGFEITSPTSGFGVMIENSERIEVADCVIHHTGRTGLLVAGSGSRSPTRSRDVFVLSNRFHHNGGAHADKDAFARIGDHSVYWGAVSSNSDGIDHSTYGGVIANNIFHSQPVGFQLQIGSQASGLIVTNNTFYGAQQPGPAGSAIALYSDSGSPSFVTRDIVVVNNVITHASNRGVYGSGGGGLMASNVVRNNQAYGNRQGDFLPYYGDRANVLFRLGENITGSPPRFVAAEKLDFRLKRSSPAVDAADPAYAWPTDALGRGRVGRPDLGAIEWVGARARR